MFEDREYFLICCLCGLCLLFLIIIWGDSITYRPFTPTISRLLADHPESIQVLFVVFVIVITEVRNDMCTNYPDSWANKLLNTQAVLFALVPLINVDYASTLHKVVAILIVCCSFVYEVFNFYWTFKKWSNPIDILHLLCIIALAAESITFVVLCYFMTETNSYIAILEYTIFMMIIRIIFELYINKLN